MRNPWMARLAPALVLFTLFALALAGCPDPPEDPVEETPTPTTPPPIESDPAVTAAAISFDGQNNPSDNVLCVQGGNQNVFTWTGTYATSHAGGETRLVGDPADSANNLFVVETLGDNGTPGDTSDDGCYQDGAVGGEALVQALFLALRIDTSPAGSYRETVCYVVVPDAANAWSAGTLTIGAPVQGGTTPYVFCLAAIDNNGTGGIETDGNGDVVSPDTEVVSVSPDGAGTIELTAAGINSGDPVTINGTSNVTLQGLALMPEEIPEDVLLRARALKANLLDELAP